MNQIYKFSDPTSGFTHYILSIDIKKNLKYLDYLCRHYIKNPDESTRVNSTLVQYLLKSKKPFTDITMELVFESEDRVVAEEQLAKLKAEIPSIKQEVKEEVLETKVETEEVKEEDVPVSTEPSTIPKKRGRKKKVPQENLIA